MTAMPVTVMVPVDVILETLAWIDHQCDVQSLVTGSLSEEHLRVLGRLYTAAFGENIGEEGDAALRIDARSADMTVEWADAVAKRAARFRESTIARAQVLAAAKADA